LDYSRKRHAFGSPIAKKQAIAFMLADMKTRIEAARLLTWRAAWMLDHGMPMNKEASMAKLMAADTAMDVTTDAVQILGGTGYMRDEPVEKWMRDAKVFQIWEGTSQIQRLVISREEIGELQAFFAIASTFVGSSSSDRKSLRYSRSTFSYSVNSLSDIVRSFARWPSSCFTKM